MTCYFTADVTRTYRYDAFGNQVAPDPNDTNPFRYNAEYFDAETGKYYLRFRYYNPTIGRFTQEDPIRFDLNWYIYANNNPILYIDPSGLAFFIYHCGDFTNQARWQTNQLVNIGQPIFRRQVDNADDFVSLWNTMGDLSDVISGVFIFTHGNPRSIWFTDGSGISIDGRNMDQVRNPRLNQTPVLRQISELNIVDVQSVVRLFSCNPGHLDAYENGGSFASVLSTRVTGGSVIGYDGNVSFGPIASIFARITGNYSPRLSSSQDGFKSWVTFYGGVAGRKAAGPQQFVNGQLNNSFIAPQPVRLPLLPQPGPPPVQFPPTPRPGQWR
jgi:RHS repeat-associated protein